MSRLRLGLLGCGGIGARHLGAAAKRPDELEVVACCGRDPERTAAFARQHGGTPYTDVVRMLDESTLDLLIVATPPYARTGEAELAASRGVHLLVEKPIALDLPTARRMVEAVEAANVRAAVGFMYRFGDAVARWRALEATGETGPVGLFAGSYHCNALHAPWWRERARSGGQMLEQVIHLIDLVRLFMGEPDTVYARAANLFHHDTPGYDVEDVSAIVFGWDDGRIANLNASNAAIPGRWQKEWRLVAERHTGRFEDWNNAVLTRTAPDVADENVAGVTDPFVAQLADLAAAIREGRPPMVPLAEGEASLRLALAARQSADERREIRLSDGV
ncbi:gfo/Idh/MocA family oxidoreductase [Phenylobacterium hankyongense]|uniref:Gfo/Idh/MocA family oxidoreductase n=1 Tax=Phenylobacterium hankyongense TaxID=1813876 RepID=A0A328AWE3_9CAUL|nr:Gfo/Idh/MocA family oxidoreductase [Phenylobacterium hankyongense]RAK58939.1 gfo/Idh/MocA family oxidoreductase [Phenylobacterium hankyongense]